RADEGNRMGEAGISVGMVDRKKGPRQAPVNAGIGRATTRRANGEREWAGRETGRFGTSEGDGTRRANPRNPPPRGESRKEKGPGDYPDPVDWWRRRESNPRPRALRARMLHA